MIAKKEIIQSQKEWTCLMVKWNFISFIGIISTGVFWAFIAKHVFKVKFKFWWLNYTKDGDWGNPNLLIKKNLLPNENDLWIVKWVIRIIGAIWWWFRNHSWEYITRFNPPWKGGKCDIIRGVEQFFILKDTLNKELSSYGRWTRADGKKEIYGTKYIVYIINGKLLWQYSFANKIITIQLGAGGDRYRLKIYKS